MVNGVADSAEEAKTAVADAFERLQLAFCTEKAEDWIFALAKMLGAGEDAAKVAGMSDEQRDRFNRSCDLARSVLARAPKAAT